MKIRVAVLFILLLALSTTVFSNSTNLLIVSLGWSGLITFIYYLICKRENKFLFRSIFFATIAVAFIVNMQLSGQTEKDIVPYCHISIAGNFINVAYNQYLAIANSSWFKFGALSLGILWLVTILINGGGFCSWVCFFGGIDDSISQILKKPLIKLPNSKKFREFQIAVFIFFAYISYKYVEPSFCLWACPFKVTNEILNPNSLAHTYQTITYIVVGMLFLLLIPLLTKKRFFCSTICPFGALPPMLAKITPYKVTINRDTCTKCLNCIDTCPSFAIDRTDEQIATNQYCTLCLRCIPECKDNAITTTINHQKQSELLPFISMVLSGSLSLFYVPLGVLSLIKYLSEVLS